MPILADAGGGPKPAAALWVRTGGASAPAWTAARTAHLNGQQVFPGEFSITAAPDPMYSNRVIITVVGGSHPVYCPLRIDFGNGIIGDISEQNFNDFNQKIPISYTAPGTYHVVATDRLGQVATCEAVASEVSVPLTATWAQTPNWRLEILSCDGAGPWTVTVNSAGSAIIPAPTVVEAWPHKQQFAPVPMPTTIADLYDGPFDTVSVTITDSVGKSVTFTEELGKLSDFTLVPLNPPVAYTYRLRCIGGGLINQNEDDVAFFMESYKSGVLQNGEGGYRAWVHDVKFLSTGWRTVKIDDMNEPGRPKISKDFAISSTGTRAEIETVPQGTVSEVLAWVGDDPVRAETAWLAETQPEVGRNRVTLIDQLTPLLPSVNIAS